MIKKTMQVNTIEEGTVIDHLANEHVFKILELLQIKNSEEEILVGINLKSKKLKKKAIIKLENRELTKKEIDEIAILGEGSRVNMIKGYQVVKKINIQRPNNVFGLVRCFNPNCITNDENIKTSFSVLNENKVMLKCKYCEKITPEENIVFI